MQFQGSYLKWSAYQHYANCLMQSCVLYKLVSIFYNVSLYVVILYMCTGGLGGWSSEGCTTTELDSSGSVECSCTHLTAFAIVQV